MKLVEHARVCGTPIALTGRRSTLHLEPGSTPLAEVFAQLGPGRELELEIADLRTNTQPGCVYRVELSTSADRTGHHVGYLNFFNARLLADPMAAEKLAHSTWLVATGAIRDIFVAGNLLFPLDVVVAAESEPFEGSRPAIGGLRLIER